MRHVVAVNLEAIHPEIIEAFDKQQDVVFYVFDKTPVCSKIMHAVLPYELATTKPCICLDFESFWALRLTQQANRWLVWGDVQFPDYINPEVIKSLLTVYPPMTYDPEITEILGVKVEKLA